jgi:hypothetical protein
MFHIDSCLSSLSCSKLNEKYPDSKILARSIDMSTMICEHPSCARSILTKCSNHCQLDLCQEHLTEHQNLFVVQYEKSLNKYHQSIETCIQTLDASKIHVDSHYQKELLSINEHYNTQLNLLEEKSLFIESIENFLKEKSDLVTNVKLGQATLHQYDLEQAKLYHAKLADYLHAESNDKS